MSAVLVFAVDTIGGDFKAFPVQKNGHRSVLDAGVDGVGKQRLHLHGLCRSGNIPVVGCSAKQAVPDASADRIGFKSGLLQDADNFIYFSGHLDFHICHNTFLSFAICTFILRRVPQPLKLPTSGVPLPEKGPNFSGPFCHLLPAVI